MGNDAALWEVPGNVLRLYDETEDALDAADAQRTRMSADDLRLLASLRLTWEEIPPRALVAMPLFPHREDVTRTLETIRQTLAMLIARVTQRHRGAVVPVPPAVPVPTPDDGEGWQWPTLPSMPELPTFPGFQFPPQMLWILALAVGALFLFRERGHR